MDLEKSYLSSASSQSLGRICTMGANFLVFVIAARLLGAELFGQYSYITIFLSLAILIAEFGTTGVLGADIARVGGKEALYWGNFLILRFVFVLITTVVAIPVAWLVRPDLFACLLVGILGLIFLGSRFFDPIFQVYEHPWYSFQASLLYGVVFALSTSSALFLHRSLFELIILYVAANIVYSVFAVWRSLPLIRPDFSFCHSIQREILSLAIPVGVSGIFTLIHTRADIFMLAAMKGDYAVGIYNGAYRFLDMAVISAVMLSNPLVPIYSRLAVTNRASLQRRYSRILGLLTCIVIPIALLVPLISTQFTAIVFGPEYREVGPLLNIMSWIGVLSFYSLFNFVILLAIKVVKFQVWLGGLTAVLNVVLNYFFIPQYSFYGSAVATLLVECIFVGVSFFYIIKSIGNVFPCLLWCRIGCACLFILVTIILTDGLPYWLQLLLVVMSWPGALLLCRLPLREMAGK